jgi:hypothetical protein
LKADQKKPLPKFGAPSRQLKDALAVLRSEPLVHALRTRADPKKAFVPSKRYEAAAQLVNEESSKRLTVLFEHFGLDTNAPNAGLSLAFFLACELIPRFDPLHVPARGAPRTVFTKHKELAIAIQGAVQQSNLSASSVCANLTRRGGPWKGQDAKKLEANYYRFLKIQNATDEIFRQHRATKHTEN